ncbi:MAG: hypothetical protein IVW57_11805 [Ktedonobacterales bacterium]|nr:hypothetical protein [Ktedonobacterales bacterium]
MTTLPRAAPRGAWRALGASGPPRTRRARALGALLLGALLLTMASGGVLAARTATSGAMLHWGAAPTPVTIATGASASLPRGPVGMRVAIRGELFPPDQRVRIVVVRGDSNQNPALCARAPLPVAEAVVNGSGAFVATFLWPADAATVNGAYSVCSYAVTSGALLSTRDDSPFTVLAASPPILERTPAQVRPGGTVTITGKGWVPPQPVRVVITLGDGYPPLVTSNATSSGLNTGFFRITLTLPVSAPPGSYTISATAQNGQLGATALHALTIVAAPATATPTATPTVVATQAPTTAPTAPPTTAPTPIVTSTNSSGTADRGLSAVVIGLAITVFVLLLILAGLLAYLLRLRRQAQAFPSPWPTAEAVPPTVARRRPSSPPPLMSPLPPVRTLSAPYASNTGKQRILVPPGTYSARSGYSSGPAPDPSAGRSAAPSHYPVGGYAGSGGYPAAPAPGPYGPAAPYAPTRGARPLEPSGGYREVWRRSSSVRSGPPPVDLAAAPPPWGYDPDALAPDPPYLAPWPPFPRAEAEPPGERHPVAPGPSAPDGQ